MPVAVEEIYLDLVDLADLVENVDQVEHRSQVGKEDSQGRDRRHQGEGHSLDRSDQVGEEDRSHYTDQEKGSSGAEEMEIHCDSEGDLVRKFEKGLEGVPERVLEEDLGAVVKDQGAKNSVDKMSAMARRILK